MESPEQIHEWLKDDMLMKYHCDTDKQNGEDMIKINSTQDIIKFIKFIQINS